MPGAPTFGPDLVTHGRGQRPRTGSVQVPNLWRDRVADALEGDQPPAALGAPVMKAVAECRGYFSNTRCADRSAGHDIPGGKPCGPRPSISTMPTRMTSLAGESRWSRSPRPRAPSASGRSVSVTTRTPSCCFFTVVPEQLTSTSRPATATCQQPASSTTTTTNSARPTATSPMIPTYGRSIASSRRSSRSGSHSDSAATTSTFSAIRGAGSWPSSTRSSTSKT